MLLPCKALMVLAIAVLMIIPASLPASDVATVVFLVRHAEKAGSSADAPLSEAGRRRAELLARILRDAGIEHIHSTDYSRTRETARPMADQLGIHLAFFDPRELETFAASLKSAGGRHLVVGHSNTTPALVSLLGGEPGVEIDESGEYDRLYVVSIAPGGQVNSILLRYGQPF
jgi:broad specificity phosphatase PhoE